MSRGKKSLDYKRIRSSIWLVLTIFVLFCSVLQGVAGSAYYSLMMQAFGTVGSPPVILEEGTAGTSTIYTNNTSAKVSVQAPAAWLNGWDKRVGITIDRNDIDTDLSNFPILVYLSNSSSGRNNDDVSFIFDELQNDTNRKKIAVTKSDGLTQCYVEIERWDDVNERAWLWIKVPNISSKGNTDLYLYYDSSQPDNTTYVGDKGSTAAQNVWNTNFKGVWHLDEDPSGTSPQMRDSTSNNHNGTSNGNMTSGDQIAGKIDGSLDFDGTDDYINTTSNELKTLNNFTLSVWFKADSTTALQHILWEGPASQNGWGDGSGNPNSHEMHLTICKFDANNTLNFFYGYEESGGVWVPAVEINMSFSDTTNWNHAIVVMSDADTSPSAELFLNGVSQGTDTGTQTNRTAWDTNLRIGRPGTNQRYFDGMTDEVRILETAVDAGWVKASYESERDDLLDFGSEERSIIDHVDNNTSDIGSPTDIGTHSNFTAQQYGPDSIYDTLTEADTGLGNITYENSAESYSATGQSSHNFNYSLQESSGDERLVVATVSWEDAQASAYISSMTFDSTPMTHIVNVTVGTGYSEYISLWYLLDSGLPSSSGSYDIAVTVSETITREIYMAVAEYSGVKQTAPDDFDTDSNTSAGNTTITLTAAANGSLVVAGVGEGETNALTNTNNINNLQEQVLTSSGSALGHQTDVDSGNITVGWDSLGTREGMAGAVWQPSKTNYELDLEVQWTNASYTLAHEELCIKTGTFSGSEDLMVHAWNGSTSDWDWIMNLTASSWNNVSVSSYLTSSNFTIRFKGGNEINDPPQDNWNIDATQLYVWTPFETTFDYILRVNNTVTDSWQIRLKEYSDSNIYRLENCTIYFHNSTDGASSQIFIENGSYTNQTGPWYNLGNSETIYIAMTVQTNSTGTSYVRTYLEIRIPDTTTYAQYIITFEIT